MLLAFAAPCSSARAAAEPESIGASADPVTIVGGEPSSTCAWPSTVFLGNCSGTLIHPEIIVMAAHCGEDHSSVWFGEAAQAESGFSVDIEHCKINPEWPVFDIEKRNGADWGYCKLAEPVLDVPVVPPLVGCETTLLTPGRPVTLVGFGENDESAVGVKHQVDTVLHYVTEFGAASIGGEGKGACYGDSGGPAFLQLPDGTWRAFGIVAAGPGFCGTVFFFGLINSAIPFIEQTSGIDVTPCHYSNGEWSPSPSCRDFPMSPADGEGKSWADGCAGGPVSGWSTTCGPAFDATEDLVAPEVSITAPPDRARFDTEAGSDTVEIGVTAEAADATSGVARIELAIQGEIVDQSLHLGPSWEWALKLPSGVWSLQAVARDWADNEAWSEPVVIGVDQDPPPAPEPEPSTSSGSADDATGPRGGIATSDSSNTSDDSGDSTSDTGGASGGDVGCGCRSTASGERWGSMLVLVVALLRRRCRARLLSMTLLLAGCTAGAEQDAGTSATEGASSTGTGAGVNTTATGVTTRSETTSVTESSSGIDASSSASDDQACEPGTLDCSCLTGYVCGDDLTCVLDSCAACEHGTFACPCRAGADNRLGTCNRNLYCIGGMCAAPAPCFYVRDGKCDEPTGTGACFAGTDTFDCCATREGVCEELSRGGPCPDGSDPLDCDTGYTSSDSGAGSTTGTSSDG